MVLVANRLCCQQDCPAVLAISSPCNCLTLLLEGIALEATLFQKQLTGYASAALAPGALSSGSSSEIIKQVSRSSNWPAELRTPCSEPDCNQICYGFKVLDMPG
jgi:hypothetical protein